MTSHEALASEFYRQLAAWKHSQEGGRERLRCLIGNVEDCGEYCNAELDNWKRTREHIEADFESAIGDKVPHALSQRILQHIDAGKQEAPSLSLQLPMILEDIQIELSKL